jgi:hypothetical protein
MTHHLSLLNMILKALEKYISPSAEDKYRCIPANLYFFSNYICSFFIYSNRICINYLPSKVNFS